MAVIKGMSNIPGRFLLYKKLYHLWGKFMKENNKNNTCGTCDWNDDNLCDKKGFLVNEDDEACNKYECNKGNK